MSAGMRVVGLVRMGVGNLLSIKTAFARIGLACRDLETPAEIGTVDALILPGVGAFHVAMEHLQANGFVAPLQQLAAAGQKPILGICLGMQLLADESEEHGQHRGLGLIASRVTRLREDEILGKVPNVGWCETTFTRKSLFRPDGTGRSTFYYVHSYHLVASNEADVAGTTLLGKRDVVAAVQRGRVAGIQFHPEKSQDNGLDLLANWAVGCGLIDGPRLERA